MVEKLLLFMISLGTFHTPVVTKKGSKSYEIKTHMTIKTKKRSKSSFCPGI